MTMNSPRINSNKKLWANSNINNATAT